MMSEKKTLLTELQGVEEAVPDDPTSASSVSRCFLMCYLASELSLKNFVEIGIYKGRFLFSIGKLLAQTGGQTIGIDPFFVDSVGENDPYGNAKKMAEQAAGSIRFPSLFMDVLQTRQDLKLDSTVKILWMTGQEACAPVKASLGGIDMLHIGGNLDTAFIAFDTAHYIPLVRSGGIIIFDGISRTGVRRIYEQYAAELPVLYEDPYFAILYKPEDGRVLCSDVLPPEDREEAQPTGRLRTLDNAAVQHYRTCLPALFENVEDVRKRQREHMKPSLFVGVLSYNHAAYIEQCLESIFRQTGDFTMHLVVMDDASTDDTWRLERELQAQHPEMTLLHNPANRGYVRNYVTMRRLFEESGCDYLAYVEGDDYLLSPARMDEHLRFLETHPECAWVFNDLVLYYQSEDRYEAHTDQLSMKQERYRVNDLAAKAFVGTWSASTFRRNAMLHIPEEFTRAMASSDWLSGVLAAECGDIGHIRRPLSVYRKHSAGAWSGMKEKQNKHELYCLLQKFNRWTGYQYSAQNCTMLQLLSTNMEAPEDQGGNRAGPADHR